MIEGEYGYCAGCARLVDVNEAGLLIQHTRSYEEFGRWHNATCRGTGESPSEPPEEIHDETPSGAGEEG